MRLHHTIRATTFGILTLAGVSIAAAQSMVTTSPGFRTFGWGWGGYPYRGYGYGASTAAEGYGYGAAAVIQAAGEYNLNTSQAAINYEQAYRMSLESSVTRAETFFARRRINESYHDAKQGPPPSRETLAERARQGVPARLSPEQFDPAFGTLFWPVAFDDHRFAAARNALDRLMADRDAQGGVGSAHYREVAELTSAMRKELRGLVDEMTPTEYVQAVKFLNSIAYEAQFVPDAQGLASR